MACKRVTWKENLIGSALNHLTLFNVQFFTQVEMHILNLSGHMGRLVRGPGLPLMVPRTRAPTHLLWALGSIPRNRDLVPDLSACQHCRAASPPIQNRAKAQRPPPRGACAVPGRAEHFIGGGCHLATSAAL